MLCNGIASLNDIPSFYPYTCRPQRPHKRRPHTIALCCTSPSKDLHRGDKCYWCAVHQPSRDSHASSRKGDYIYSTRQPRNHPSSHGVFQGQRTCSGGAAETRWRYNIHACVGAKFVRFCEQNYELTLFFNPLMYSCDHRLCQCEG